MSSLPAIGGHKAIKPEYVVSSSSGYYPVKSEEVETDNEEDTNTSKNEHDQHINIKDEHNRVKVEVKTEDDNVSTDDEGIGNSNKNSVELQSSQFVDIRTQATSKAIAEKKSNGGCWIDHIEWSASKDYDRLAIIQQKNAKTKEDRKEAKILKQRILRYRTRVMDAQEKENDYEGYKKLLSYLDAKDLQLRKAYLNRHKGL